MVKFSQKRIFGNLGEDIACQFLERQGYKIIERNYLRPWGEIDIIAEKENVVHVIEVKSISRENTIGKESGPLDYRPEELVSRKKLEKLSRTASLYMDSRRDDREYQIDVVGVLISKTNRTARCRFFEQVLG